MLANVSDAAYAGMKHRRVLRMGIDPAAQFARLAKRTGVAALPAIAGWSAIVLGATVTLGWALDVDWLKSFIPGLLTMKANTAFCFIALGVALVLTHTGRAAPLAFASATFAVLVSAVTLAEYTFRLDFAIDQLVFREQPDTTRTIVPGRMSPISAACFTLLGVGVLLVRAGRAPVISATVAAVAMVLAAINVLDFFYQADAPTFLAGSTQMALNTAAGCVLVALGVLAAHPNGGVLAIFSGNRTTAALSRRLIVAAILIPVTLGWLRLLGQQAGLYDTAYGLTLTTVATISLLVALIWYSARQVGYALAARDEAEGHLRDLARELSRSNDELQQFASVASHDLQEPLRKILAFGDRLRTE